MEKLIYLLYSPNDTSESKLANGLHTAAGEHLARADGVRSLHLYLPDAEVEPARPKRMQTSERLPDAMLSIWLDHWIQKTQLESTLKDLCHFHAYLVTESEPLALPSPTGARVPGMCQIALLQRPPRLSRAEWIDIWQGSHTQVALDTQSTFGYRQNVVVRPLTSQAPACDAIVEENFPAEAMTSPHAFYACEGDDEQLQQRVQTMMTSCQRFIDFDKIDVVPMSQYIVRA